MMGVQKLVLFSAWTNKQTNKTKCPETISKSFSLADLFSLCLHFFFIVSLSHMSLKCKRQDILIHTRSNHQDFLLFPRSVKIFLDFVPCICCSLWLECPSDYVFLGNLDSFFFFRSSRGCLLSLNKYMETGVPSVFSTPATSCPCHCHSTDHILF